MAVAEGLSSACAFPIIADDEVIGVVELFTNEIVDRDPDVLEVLETLGRVLGVARP
jgi:GAF domain-containing protein